MAYYSFVVIAPHPVGVPEPMVLLDTGLNVFSAEVKDLDGFLKHLRTEGVEVRQFNRLDAHMPSQASDLLVEEREPEQLPEVTYVHDDETP